MLELTHLQRWILLDGNRNILAMILAGVGFLMFALVGYSGTMDVGETTGPLLYLFSALAGGNITLITLVITISQLILSRELRSPRELQLELESAEEYRESVEDETEGPGVPEHPEEFLRNLIDETHHHVVALDSTTDELSESMLRDELQELTSNLQGELAHIRQQLSKNHGGIFSALSIVLTIDFGAYLNHSRWIRQAENGKLSDDQRLLLEDLEQRIEQLDIARQYFKTIHLMQALADLSKLIMPFGFVATVVSLVFLIFLGYAQSPLAPLTRIVLFPLAVSIGLVPLSLLIAHILRITTIARRTAAITPFISPEK